MLPNRGMLRSGQAVRLPQMATRSRPAGCARNFGTAGLPRRTGASRTNPSSPMSFGQLSGRRAGLVAAAPGARRHPQMIPSASAAFSLNSLNPMSWWSSKPKDPSSVPFPDQLSGSSPTPAAPETAAPVTPADTVATPAQLTIPTTPTPPADAATSSALPNLPTPDGLEGILDGSALLDMPEQIGYLHALGLDFGYGPTSLCQWAIEHMHIYTGLPWWASILGVTLLFRGAMLLPSLNAAEQSARMQVLQKDPKFAAIQEELKDLAFGTGGGGMRSDAKQTRQLELRAQMKQMQKRNDVTMWKTFIPLIQLPFGIGMFRLLRSMADMPVPGWENAGLLWFQDLSVPDPLFLLPVASAGVMFLIFKSNLRYMAESQIKIMRPMQYIMTPMTLVFTINMSAGLTFFFFITSLTQAFQTWLWHQPWLRNWAGMPPLSTLKRQQQIGTQAAAFRLAPQSTWQAPRVISAKNKEADSGSARKDGEAAAGTIDSVGQKVDQVKSGWNKMMGKAKERKSKSAAKDSLTKAEEYEKKRAMEEEEELYRRREAERQYRRIKKSMDAKSKQK